VLPIELINAAFYGGLNEAQQMALTLPQFTCQIDLLPHLEEYGVRLENCWHIYFVDNLRRYLETKINDGQVLDNQLTCPECSTSISYMDIQKAISPKAFNRYCNSRIKLANFEEEKYV
jgi:hypothetical protein